MRYLFLLHTLIMIKALGSMHILRNQHSGPPSPYSESQKEHFHALEKMGHELRPGFEN